jgi:DNA-directed RNA polymerase specialized sigma subunit
MLEFAEIVSQAVVNALKDNGVIGNTNTSVKEKPEKAPKTAYQKTEQLLFNYNGFKRIVAERKQEIADLRRYGVPQKSAMSGGERVQTSRTNVGIVLPEDAVEDAVRNVERSVHDTVQAIALIDKCMAMLKNDPYYDILPMRYFEGRTLEDIGVYFGCDHTTISRNKNRLVRELAMRLFPDEVVNEIMN